jgi:hypothetical protein
MMIFGNKNEMRGAGEEMSEMGYETAVPCAIVK